LFLPFKEKPVWIQAVTRNTATVGFIDGTPDKEVFIEDLYDEDLYQDRGKRL
jgi:hypothetical protein